MSKWLPWCFWALVAAGVAAVTPGFAQTGAPPAGGGAVTPPTAGPVVPEKVAPGATIPPTGSGPAVQPRSENPLVGGETRPVPDSGVIAPPANGAAASTPVIKPPSMGTMPVIKPPTTSSGVVIVPK